MLSNALLMTAVGSLLMVHDSYQLMLWPGVTMHGKAREIPGSAGVLAGCMNEGLPCRRGRRRSQELALAGSGRA